jgi:hypothetical protein
MRSTAHRPRSGPADGRGHQHHDRPDVLHRLGSGGRGRRRLVPQLRPHKFDIGFQAGLKSFTAAVLGGIGNTTGAALGGFLIAFVEVFSSQLGYARWSEAIVFSILILVLVFDRPASWASNWRNEHDASCRS